MTRVEKNLKLSDEKFKRRIGTTNGGDRCEHQKDDR